MSVDTRGEGDGEGVFAFVWFVEGLGWGEMGYGDGDEKT